MGYDLSSESGEAFRFGYGRYYWMLERAKEHGWKPQGTTMPQWHEEMYGPTDWPGFYQYNDYQVVSAEDAANMADALERGLPEAVDGAKMEEQKPYGHTRDFIRFLRLGSYETW